MVVIGALNWVLAHYFDQPPACTGECTDLHAG